MNEQPWSVYLVECVDGSLYCGIAVNVDARVRRHNAGRGAKYTRSRLPVRLRWQTVIISGKGEAMRVEYRVKRLSRPQKELLIRGKKLFPLIFLPTQG